MLLTRRILWAAHQSIYAINATLADQDPYNHQYPPDPTSDWCSLRDCEFPDEVDDPLALIRLLRGEAAANQLEYEDDLEHIAHVLTECFEQALRESGFQPNQLGSSSDEEDVDDESSVEEEDDGRGRDDGGDADDTRSSSAFLADVLVPC